MKSLVFFLFTYPAGVLIGLLFWSLRIVGILKVEGWENFPKQKGKVLVVSNHPYKGEQFLQTGIFFHQYVFKPFYGPWSIVDRKNYYDRYPLLRPRLIPVDRTGIGDAKSIKVAIKIIASGANIILFPEGGRTSKGTFFLTSQKGKKIRPLKGGFAVLATEPGTILVPTWYEFSSWSIRLTIGEPISFVGVSREEVVHRTEKILLELADKTS